MKRGTDVKTVRKMFVGLLACGACAAACAGTVRTVTAPALTLDTRIGLVKVVEDAATLRLSTRWDGTEAGVLTVNGAEAARLGAAEETDHVLDGLAPGEYVCSWTTGASTNLATFCVRGGASALPPGGAGVRTATAAAITLDTRIGLMKVVEDAAMLRLSTRWDGTEVGVLTVNGTEAARLGADEEADHVLGGLAPGEYVCQWTTSASTNLATFCVRGGASVLPPDGAGVRTATAVPVVLDTRIGLLKVVEDAATLRLSTRWDGVPEGVLTVNGAEAARLWADAEADHVLDGLAPGEYVCQWTTGVSTNLATFCVRGGASVLPPDGAGVRTATAAPVALDTRIGLVKVVEGAATLRLSTRWDGVPEGVLTVNGAEAARLGADAEADHVLDGLAPGEYVCSWTTGASTNLVTFCVRGGASILPPDGAGVRTATAAPVTLDTRIGLVKVVEDAATLRLSTRWDGVPEGVLTVNGAEAARLGAEAEADHVLDGLAPGEYVCRWTTGASTNLATFCVRGGASALPPDGAGVRTATAAPLALDTRIGLYKVLPVSDRGVASAVCRLSTRWDGAESGTLTVNGEEVRALGTSEEVDHRMDNLAPGEYVCRWTAGDAAYLATFSVRGDGSARPPRTGVEVTITGHTATYPYDGCEKRAGGFVVTTSDPLYTADDFVFTGNSNAVRTAVGTTAFGMSASDFANVNPDFADVVFHVVDGSVTVTPGAVVNPFDPFDPSAPSAPGALARADCVAVYDGEGHSISVAPLLNPALAADGASVTYSLDPSRVPFAPENPVFTNAVSTSVWYRIASPNYAPLTTNALLEIRPRTVTLTSGTKTDFVYDGQPHACPHFIKSGHDFVAGEGIVASNWATVTRVDEGEVANTFDYTWYAGTRAENYALTVVTGRIAVIAAPIPVGPGGVVTAVGYTNVYDGAAHGVAVSVTGLLATPTVQYRTDETEDWVDASPVYSNVCDTQVWYRVSAPNYAPEVGSIGIKITKRPVTLTSKSAAKVYDGMPLTAHEVAVGGDGFVDGEGATYAFTGEQTAVGTSENTFTYALNGKTSAGNYAITTVNGTLTVTKASIGGGEGGGGEPGEGDVPDGGLSKFDVAVVYDGAGHTIDTNALVVAFGAAMIGENTVEYAADDGSAGIGGRGAPALPWGAAPVYTNAGTYVVWYRVTNPNYEDFVHAAKVTIAKRPVTVSVAGHTATYAYDTTEKSVSGYDAATEDALYDIAADTVFSGTAAASRTDAGTTAMGLTPGGFANSSANFHVTYEVADGWLRVTPRVIGDDPSNWDIRLARNPMYDGTEQSAPITQVAFVKPDGNLDDIPYALSGNTATDAGNYVVRITGTGNYAGTVEKDWAIAPRSITLASGHAEWVYDGAAHSESGVTVTGDGFAPGEGAAYSGFPVVRHVADAAEAMANAFAYAFNANTKAQNYEVTTRFGTVKMTPRAVTLTAPTKEKPYDGTPLTFGAEEVEAVATGATLPGGGQGLPALPEGEAFTLGDFARITEAGRVDATFTVADGTARMADYALTIVPGTLTVTRNATQITVTAKSGSWTYDGQPHTLHEYEATNLGVLQPGDVLDVAFSDDSAVTTPIDGPGRNGIVANVITGVRVMRGEADVTSNYTLAPYNGTLMVTKRPVALTSRSASKTYDGEPLTAHEVEIGGDGFVGEDGAAFTFTGSQTVVGKSRNTFAYALKGGTNAGYYDITKMEGELEVTAADISAGDDSDWQIVMGPPLAYTGLEQIQTLSSVTYKGLPLDYTVVGNAQTDAGNYTMTLTGQGNFTGMRDVAWAIAPKALSLAAGSGSRVYDGTAFTVGTVTAVGFAPGEGAEYECAGSQADVGSSQNNVATISWNANTKGSNYAVTKLPGTLTVTPRPVTLTAANISKPYDGTPLALTAADIAVNGMVAGESFVFGDFASRTEAGQTPATFSYAAGPGTKLGNYAVTVTPGATITITKSATAISVTAASGSWAYDGEPHSNRTWTAANLDTLQTGDALEVTFDDASVVTTPQDGPEQNGVVANAIANVRVIRNGMEDVTANYTVEWFPGTLTVTKRPVTVDVKGRTETFTYDGNEKSVEGYEVATEDELYDISADTVFSGTAASSRTDAGTTAMGLVATDFTNNNDCFEVTYAVTDGWVKVEPLDIAAAGDDFAIALGVNPKYNGTVQSIPVESVVCRGLPVTFTRTGENATHAGTYTLTVKANGNFTGERSTTWRMLRRQVTLTSGSATKPYDGSPVRCGDVHIAGDGFIGLEGATFDVRGSQTVAGSSKNAFSYTLKAGTLSGDYDIVKVEGDLTVTKATYPGQEPGGAGIAWSVAPGAATWMYDGRPHGVALTGVPAGVTARLAGNEATDAGDYVATVTLDYDAANYEPPAAPAPLAWSIARRPLTLMAASREKPYDGFPLAVRPGDITASGSGYADGECLDYFGFASITDVGETAATFSYRDSATAKVANYDVTVAGGQTLKVTVGGDQISVTADSATWAYDGEEHRAATWRVGNGDKLLAGHELRVAVDPASVVRTPADGPDGDGVVSNRFASVRIVEAATGADRTRNYNLVLKESVLRMTNACIRAEQVFGADDVAKVYDGVTTQVVVTAELLQPARVRYFADGAAATSAALPEGRGDGAAATSAALPEDRGDGAAATSAALPEDAVWSGEPSSFTHATNATVWFTVEADYYNAYTGRVDVAIAKRAVTLTTPTKAKTYDGAPLTFGADEVELVATSATLPEGRGDGAVATSATLPEGESFVFSDFAAITDAGRVPARCAYVAGAGTRLSDYAVTEDWGTLTVLASADEITVTADSATWAYDGTAHRLPSYTAENADKLRPGDALDVAFAPESVVLTPEDGPDGDGVVSNAIASVRVLRHGTEDVTRNYSLAWYPGVLRVTKARMTFDGAGSADPSGFSTAATYDGAGHTVAVVPPRLLTAPVTVRYYGAVATSATLPARGDGAVATSATLPAWGDGAVATSATLPEEAAWSGEAPAFTNAGVHTVFYALDARHYETYFGTATVTIAPRPVTLVSDGAEKVYDGTPLRCDAVRVKDGSPGFVDGEGFAATCSGALTDVGAMENLFDYALTGGALAGNYTITKEYGWLRVTPATLDPGAVFGGGETDADGGPLCARVYNGAPQPFAPAPDFGEPFRLSYALVPGDESAYSETAPTRTHVAEGDLAVYFKFLSPNYAPYYGKGTLRIVPKALTEEMCVADEDAAWFFDGTEKRPAVTVVDGEPNIATADDYTLAYSGRTGAGLFPVTVTGTNDYCGVVTKEFAILKRPVAPPVIPSRAYSGRLQKPTIAADARWTVAANPGGTDAGLYTNVVLRLANTADYKWKGLGGDEADWTGVFEIRKGANGWSTYPGLRSWTNGVEAANEPTGRARFGTLSVAYRRRGAPVASETAERPSAPGRYTARFWVEETKNYAGVGLAAPYDIDFEIFRGPDDPPAGDATTTTPVPVPYAWLDAYVGRFGGGDYEAAAHAPGANGVALWESYVAGLDPADAASRFTASIALGADGTPVVTWSPDLRAAEPPRAYTVYGKPTLGAAAWTPVTDANRAAMRFFKVAVEVR